MLPQKADREQARTALHCTALHCTSSGDAFPIPGRVDAATLAPQPFPLVRRRTPLRLPALVGALVVSLAFEGEGEGAGCALWDVPADRCTHILHFFDHSEARRLRALAHVVEVPKSRRGAAVLLRVGVTTHEVVSTFAVVVAIALGRRRSESKSEIIY